MTYATYTAYAIGSYAVCCFLCMFTIVLLDEREEDSKLRRLLIRLLRSPFSAPIYLLSFALKVLSRFRRLF